MITRPSAMPGFRLTLAVTVIMLGIIVVVPLASVFLHAARAPWEITWAAISSARAMHSYRLTFGAALVAALAAALVGTLVAWVLVRYRFPGRAWLDAAVDLPLALPTAVAGLSLTALYSEHGLLGEPLMRAGLKVAFTPIGIALALLFVGFPFVVRAVQPVLEALDADVEEAAAVLGASRWQTFRLVVLPAILPGLVTGFAMALARGIGEYGSVVFIAGNLPMKTEITPLLVVTKLEQYDYAGATALAVVMLTVSLAMLAVVGVLHRRTQARAGAAR